MELNHTLLIVALLAISIAAAPSVFSLFAGQHDFYGSGMFTESYCLKCHSDILKELSSSAHHSTFSCSNCHGIPGTDPNQTHGNLSAPACLDCHGTAPATVTDQNNITWTAPTAAVYNESSPGGADAHIPFVTQANNSILKGVNAACISCHSSLSNGINFSRPEYIDWNVTISNGNWTITNLNFGQNKTVSVTKSGNWKLHNITSSPSCIACHADIMQAVMNGGHANLNQNYTGSQHSPANFADTNVYCKSCHNPQTYDSATNSSPYPAYPFNSPIHSAIGIDCWSCHGEPQTLEVNISGSGFVAIPNDPASLDANMKYIVDSINIQPAFTHSYFCIACHDVTGINSPFNGSETSVHFRMYTEPNVNITLTHSDGTTQTYP